MLIINQMIGYSIWLLSSPILEDPSHKSHNVLYKYLTMSHFVTKLCTTLAHFFYKMMYCVIWGITTTRSAAVAAMTPSPPSWSLFLYSLFDITGTKVGPFLLNSNFRHGVGDWLGMYEGACLGPSILPTWAGDILARGPAVPADSVCEAMWAFETGGLWASPTGVVLWALPTGVVFWTPTEGVSGWAPPTMVCSKVFNLCS